MSSKTKIEWTEATWNPITGCTKISEGCMNCYAESMANRLKTMGIKKYENGFKVTLHPKTLIEPIKMKKPRIIFVCSMSDLFHEKVPLSYINEVLDVIRATPRHTYQILTKRPAILQSFDFPKNVWLGVSVESCAHLDRIDCLRNSNARTKFISFEPLLRKIEAVNLRNIDWVIVGSESGKKARYMNMLWVRLIKNRCVSLDIPFFFKQVKVNGKLVKMPELDGKVWDQYPQGSFKGLS